MRTACRLLYRLSYLVLPPAPRPNFRPWCGCRPAACQRGSGSASGGALWLPGWLPDSCPLVAYCWRPPRRMQSCRCRTRSLALPHRSPAARPAAGPSRQRRALRHCVARCLRTAACYVDERAETFLKAGALREVIDERLIRRRFARRMRRRRAVDARTPIIRIGVCGRKEDNAALRRVLRLVAR